MLIRQIYGFSVAKSNNKPFFHDKNQLFFCLYNYFSLFLFIE